MADAKAARRYRKRKRAIQEEETRQRITEVLVEMHRTVGPANTTVTEVAERAGVSRMTVYNHFPTDAALFEACSSHWFVRNPLPDPEEWSALPDPEERLRYALRALYRWYRQTQDMMGKVLRDAADVPAVGDIMEARWWPYLDRVVDTLGKSLPRNITNSDRRAVLRLVVDFGTWKTLADAGLSDARAADLSFRMVECLAAHTARH